MAAKYYVFVIKKRAFLYVDQITSVPLKEEWYEWLWEEAFYSEQLDSFGYNDLIKEVWKIRIPKTEELEQIILEGIKDKSIN